MNTCYPGFNIFFCFSDLSNDDDDDEEPSSSLALSYCVPQPSLASSTSSIKKQRSLTPDKDINTDSGPSNFHLNLKKQRSLTPERRTMSLTPEERRKIVAKHTPPPSSRQYEMSKSNVERQRGKLSRSSSSSSYSGDEARPRRVHMVAPRHGSNKASSNNMTSSNNSLDSGGDHRIRRSR